MKGKAASPVEPKVRNVRKIPDGVEIEIFLPDLLLYFEGHFPGNPVLPGVAQIDWAVLFADRYLDTNIGGARNFQVKFRSVIQPGGPLTLTLRRPMNTRRLLFEFRGKETIFSSGSIALEDAS